MRSLGADMVGLLFAVIGVVVVGLFVVVARGLIRYDLPEDEWAPIEAAVGRKFLGQTHRSRRRWVRDPSGRQHLLEATKHDVGYKLLLDGENVGFALPADLGEAMDGLEHKIREGQP